MYEMPLKCKGMFMSVWAFLSSGFLWTLIPLPQVGVEPIATVVIAATADLAPQQSAQHWPLSYPGSRCFPSLLGKKYKNQVEQHIQSYVAYKGRRL